MTMDGGQPGGAEEYLLTGFRRGEVVALGDVTSENLPAADDAAVTVRAEWIRTVLFEHASASSALRVAGAYISGRLDLTGAHIDMPLAFERCRFEQAPILVDARLESLRMSGSHLPGIRARGVVIRRDLACDRGFVATDAIDLHGASVGGAATFHDSSLGSQLSEALTAPHLSVAEDLLLDRARIQGPIRLDQARVGGQISLVSCVVDAPDVEAVSGTGLVVHAGIDLSHTRVTGTIRLGRMRCGGDLIADQLQVSDAGIGPAVHLARSQVDGDVHMPRLRASGVVELDDVMVNGSLDLSNARIGAGPSSAGLALALSGCVVQGSLFMDQVTLRGGMRLDGADVEGDVVFRRADIATDMRTAVHAGNLAVGGAVRAEDLVVRGGATFVASRFKGDVVFDGAKIGASNACALDLSMAVFESSLFLTKGFSAFGAVVLDGATGRMIDVSPERLESNEDGLSLSADGLQVGRLTLRPQRPPEGSVALSRAKAESFIDSEELWATSGGVVTDDFSYLQNPALHTVPAHTRLNWLRRNVTGNGDWSSYDRLAGAYRREGAFRAAASVFVAKKRHQNAMSTPGFRFWGALVGQLTGYGYRPGRAVIAILLVQAAGSLWFSIYPPRPIDVSYLFWNPHLYVADLLIPLIDLGYSHAWQAAPGAAQWVAAVITFSGWLLTVVLVAAAVGRFRDR